MTTIVSETPRAAEGSLATPIWWPLRLWMCVEVVFGLLSIGSVFLNPQDTPTSFAWPIQPVVMAALLGSFYFAAAPLFVLPLFAGTWQQIRSITIPTAIFATVMLLATALHWDKFSLGTLPFYGWFASYILPPPIFGALYWWHQRRSAPVGTGIDRPLPGWVRSFLRANGLAVTAIAALLFAAPALLDQIGPWKFTPLTVRTLCGWLIGVGTLQLWMAWENDWRRVRLASTMLMLLPLAIAVQLARFSAEVNWGNLALWALILDTSAAAVIMFWMWLRERAQPIRMSASNR